MTLAVRHLDVFAAAPGGGNPCPVVLDADDVPAKLMRAIAAHYGHETAFVLHDDDGGLRLRYFVPRHEMSMCVHATVAAITVLATAGGSSSVVRTASGDCQVTWNDDTPPLVTVEQQPPSFGVPVDLARELESALGSRSGAVDDRWPIRSVSVSRPKLIVPLRDAADVHGLRPNLPALWELCERSDTTGAYLFAPHAPGRSDHVVARQFPVDAGYPEDPATGVAAGALAAHLADLTRPTTPGWCDVDIDQGDAMGRPSRLCASAFADADGVYRSTVAGRAVLGRREELDPTSVPGSASE